MTPSQYATLLHAVRDVGTRLEQLEERVAFLWPCEDEIPEQIERELASILAGTHGTGVQVFDE
jgi:hypothetical protein